MPRQDNGRDKFFKRVCLGGVESLPNIYLGVKPNGGGTFS